MRSLRLLAVIAICVLGLSLVASAGPNQLGIANSRNISFVEPVRVGNVLLPAGEYQVLHTMQGTEHIMVFKQLKAKNPVEAHVKCQLVPLQAKAPRTETVYALNAANERVLRSLTFHGDSAQHVF
jgi:hypothetical protein